MKTILRNNALNEQCGVSVVLVAIFLVLFLGIAALAIDISHLYLVRNELQNAADAGALAGARMLYTEDGIVNPGAKNIAKSATVENVALAIGGATEVDVVDEEVQLGHWSFGIGDLLDRGFYPVSTLPTDPPELLGVPTADLDQNANFVNAVQVIARRGSDAGGTAASSFFAQIFGYDKFFLSATATAFLGFAGTIYPGEVDQPIAMCAEDLKDGCKTGRMMNSSNSGETSDTARWTNFLQPCGAMGNNPDLVCSGGNEDTIMFGTGMTTTNGEQDNVLRALMDDTCWGPYRDNNQSFPMTLPVVDCTESPNCSKLLGVVEVHVLWMIRDKLMSDIGDQAGDPGPLEMKITNPEYDPTAADPNDPNYDPDYDVPQFENEWKCTYYDEQSEINNPDSEIYKKCWNEFVNHYLLLTKNGKLPYVEVKDKDYVRPPVPLDPETNLPRPYVELKVSDLAPGLFLLPECDFIEPTGGTGGQNFGVLAKTPVLVE